MKWHLTAALLLLAAPALAQDVAPTKCESCAAWNVPTAPYRIYGNTYYVGTRDLSAILITSPDGLVLIDAALPESAPQIAGNIRSLGFDPANIKFILNSHAHFDHAGGIAWLQKRSGAKVALSPWSAATLARGNTDSADPQFGLGPDMPKVANIQTLRDGQALRVGTLSLMAYFTPGHTPGGTSWSWQSCEQARCLNLVYVDSLTAVSADSYYYTAHPELLQGFAKSFATLESLPCDILLTPHPGFSNLAGKLRARDTDSQADAFINPQACRSFAAAARSEFQKRLAREDAALKARPK
jgi:metallo-beta-lactamase class B